MDQQREKRMTEAGNNFLNTLTELRGGETQADLHRELEKLVGAVRSVGKAGELNLKLKVALAKGSTHTLVVTDEVTIKEPKADREITILFADDANKLSRRDPRQPKLPSMEPKNFRPRAVNENVNVETGEVRE